ncbi:MAG: Hsp20/alpha crystallin family protein [Promethearchaeota archaeon]
MPNWSDLVSENLQKKIANNLNRVFNDNTKSKKFDYYFEPIIKDDLSKDETQVRKDLYRVYPHGKRAFNISYNPGSENRINIEDESQIDPITLKDFLQALDFVERKHVYYKSADVNPFIDFFEDDEEIVIIVEIPGMQEDDIELRASPWDVDIYALGTRNKSHYYRTIQLQSEIDPIRSKATYNEGILEVFLKKVKHKPKTKIKINK